MRWGLSKKKFRWTFRFLGLSRKEVRRLWSMPEVDAKRYMNDWLRVEWNPSSEARRLCDVPSTESHALTDEELSRLVREVYAEATTRRSFEGWWPTFWIGVIGLFVLLIRSGWHRLRGDDALAWLVLVLAFHFAYKAEYLYTQSRQLAKGLDKLGAETGDFVDRFRLGL